MSKQYAERDPMELDRDGNYYCRHVSAMTDEGLHKKSDIAAELAWRDREIDRLRALTSPAGGEWVMVPRVMHLTPEAMDCLAIQCGGVDPYSADVEDRWCGGTLWFGELEGDENTTSSYGLHIANFECPEEGSITLAEFPPPMHDHLKHKESKPTEADALPPHVALALDYSRNFADAKPDIGATEREHIIGLCNLLESAYALAARSKP